jgi:hypothetical protein
VALLTDKMVTDEFLADIRRDSMLPAVQSQWTHQRILDVAYDEILSSVAIPLTEIDHSYYRESVDTALVASQAEYDIPRYAMLAKVHKAVLVDTSENVHDLIGLNPSEIVHFNDTTAGHPRRIRIDGLQMVLAPAPSAADITTWDTLRTWIYRTPSRLVRLSTDGSNTGRAATVSSVNSGTGVVTYTGSKPSDFTSSSVHDFYSGTYPFRRIGSAVSATASPGATQQTFSTTNAALLEAGDFVCLRDETCVVPVPSRELLKPLRNLVIASIHATSGDKKGYEIALQQFQAKVTQLYPAASNRMQNNMAAMTLLASPFLRAMRAGGRRMVND